MAQVVSERVRSHPFLGAATRTPLGGDGDVLVDEVLDGVGAEPPACLWW